MEIALLSNRNMITGWYLAQAHFIVFIQILNLSGWHSIRGRHFRRLKPRSRQTVERCSYHSLIAHGFVVLPILNLNDNETEITQEKFNSL